MKNVAILGSTGSIGRQTLEVIGMHRDLFSVVALAAGRNVDLLVKQVEAFQPSLVSVTTPELAEEAQARLPYGVRVVWGERGLIEVATHVDSHFLLNGILGSIGLKPTLAAIAAGKDIGIANKETLVSAGSLVTCLARKHQVKLLPVDSEHSAIFQAMQGNEGNPVRRLILTASGGSLRNWRRDELSHATFEQVMNHPNWSMGAKITVDSATMMNKGLEVIEAHWLFDVPFDKIEVIIHPESIVHSMVEYEDGAVMAQLGSPDMRVPIQYALSYPKRIPLPALEPLSFTEFGALHFYPWDPARYPALTLAYKVGRSGGTYPAVFNAANETAVNAYLAERLPFDQIEGVVEQVLSCHEPEAGDDLAKILAADAWARQAAQKVIGLQK